MQIDNYLCQSTRSSHAMVEDGRRLVLCETSIAIRIFRPDYLPVPEETRKTTKRQNFSAECIANIAIRSISQVQKWKTFFPVFKSMTSLLIMRLLELWSPVSAPNESANSYNEWKGTNKLTTIHISFPQIHVHCRRLIPLQ